MVKAGMTSVAVKKNPKLWAEAKERACSEGKMCKHSARKMQWATRYYKEHGGTYEGSKSRDNKLSKKNFFEGAVKIRWYSFTLTRH